MQMPVIELLPQEVQSDLRVARALQRSSQIGSNTLRGI